ncbi:MAG: DUF2341 domain-containing protein [Deltaproteobacteria bacterium]|jgi:biopolymer transport protein ExbB|nr:DUF2341 domain-containing protein [Deltaproteobacteria bacterium]MBW2533933.1 DUF2341 domain-containing protein [Deltaproteobacteria bacterium]
MTSRRRPQSGQGEAGHGGASWWAALAVAGLVGGCNVLLGYDEGRPDPSGSGGAAAGGSAGTGGSAGSGGSGAGGTGGSGGGGGQADWWNADWPYRMRISFDNSTQAETLSNVPVGIRLDGESFDYDAAQDGGQDLRFVDSDHATVLDHEIELWQPGDTSTLWVEVPAIDGHSSTDHIWLYYGNPTAPDAQNRAGVWVDQSVGVYHLETDLLHNFPDIVGGNTATPQGDARAAPALLPLFGGAASFDGDGDSLYVGSVADFAVDAGEVRTVTGWFLSATDKSAYLLHQEGSSKGWTVQLRPGGDVLGAFYWTDGGTQSRIVDTTGVNYHDDEWHHVAFVIDRGDGMARLYVDGSLADGGAISKDAAAAGTGGDFANDYSGTQDFHGLLDEWWILDGARSEDWARAQYLNGAPDSFVTYGNAEPGPR